MTTRDEAVEIPVDGRRLPGTLVAPATTVPGVLFVQGWGSGQEVYLPRAREIAALGCLCLTFEPRGVAKSDPWHERSRAKTTCATSSPPTPCWPASRP